MCFVLGFACGFHLRTVLARHLALQRLQRGQQRPRRSLRRAGPAVVRPGPEQLWLSALPLEITDINWTMASLSHDGDIWRMYIGLDYDCLITSCTLRDVIVLGLQCSDDVCLIIP